MKQYVLRVVLGLGLASLFSCGPQGELDNLAPQQETALSAATSRPAKRCGFFPQNKGRESGYRARKKKSASALEVAQPVTVSLTFDDGLAEHVTAGAMLKQRGFLGTFYVISGQLGFDVSMTLPEIRALQAGGHEIGGHTMSHPELPTIALGDNERQICNDRTLLLNYGLNVESLAYPYGSQNAATEAYAQSCGYNSGRTVGPLDDNETDPVTESIPPADPYAIRTTWSVRKDTTLAEMQSWITDAQAVGGWTTLVFHEICDTANCGEYSITTANLNAFLDFLAGQPNVTVKPIRDVMGGSVKPAVFPGNTVLNPSLESDLDPTDSLADYWQTTWGWGTNSKTWSRVTGGHSGTYAEHLTVSSYTNGVVLFSPVVDGATPPVIPGHRYTLTGWYKSTAQPKWAVYYRDQNGGWNSFTASASLPASASWSLSSFTTPPLPAGATALNFGLALVSTGSLTSDDFAVADAALSAATTTAVSTAPNPSTAGQTVTFTAKVSSGSGTPSGTITFKDGATVLGTGTLSGSGVATFSTSTLTAGTHPISAFYGGGTSFAPSSSAAVNQVVNAATAPLLQNPSLESVTSGVPTCWQRTKFGTNNAVFTRSSDAHRGFFAERIDITSYTDGAGRTLPKQDSGACAPAGVPGKRYKVTGWYKTTGRPVWVLWYRSSAGVWSWWAQSPPLTPVLSYAQSSFTTPVLPAGATHISFALSLYGIGSLTMDDFTLTALP